MGGAGRRNGGKRECSEAAIGNETAIHVHMATIFGNVFPLYNM